MNLATANRQIDNGLLPTMDEIGLVGEGDHVRLQLESGARFWARVAEVRQSGTYKGFALDTVQPVNKGDLVFFEKRHVFGVV